MTATTPQRLVLFQKRGRYEWRRFALIAIYLLPPILVIWLIASFGVDVPYWDQWSLTNFLVKIHDGSVAAKDFFAPHNEHRVVFPKIIISGIAFATDWNHKLEMYLGLGLAIVTFGLLYLISRKTALNSQLFHGSNVVSCFLFFSLAQWENWLWGFQIAWFIVDLCLIAAVASIVLLGSKRYPYQFLLAGLFCFLASFSSAHGLLTWLALTPLILFHPGPLRQRWIRSSLWLITFVVVVVIYRSGNYSSISDGALSSFLEAQASAIPYFLTLLGNAFGIAIFPLRVVGVALLLNFLIFNIYFLRRPGTDLSQAMAPWIAIGWFPILFSMMTTVGRATLGIEQATASRYVTVSVLLVIALIQLWRIFISQRVQNASLLLAGVFLSGILFTLYWGSNAQAINIAKGRFHQLTAGKLCLEVNHFFDFSRPDKLPSCFANVLPHPEVNSSAIFSLDRLGFLNSVKPGEISFILDADTARGHVDSPLPTSRNVITSDQENFMLTGWATLLHQRKDPVLVLLSTDEKVPFLAASITNLSRPDIAEALGSSVSEFSGWQLELDTQLLQAGEHTLKLWIYDPENQQFIKLPEEIRVSKIAA